MTGIGVGLGINQARFTGKCQRCEKTIHREEDFVMVHRMTDNGIVSRFVCMNLR